MSNPHRRPNLAPGGAIVPPSTPLGIGAGLRQPEAALNLAYPPGCTPGVNGVVSYQDRAPLYPIPILGIPPYRRTPLVQTSNPVPIFRMSSYEILRPSGL
jgi:hypothetical protein